MFNKRTVPFQGKSDEGSTTKPPGLTTTKAPFIETARANGDIFIHQPYELYSEENHETWRKLYARLLPHWQLYANDKFKQGIENVMLSPDRIPRLDEINDQMHKLTGFKAEAVSGHVPAYTFFDKLRHRIFPTTITIRDGAVLDYLPEPDCFHDMAGHVPMHLDKTFSDVLVRFGEVAHSAAIRVQSISDLEEQKRLAHSNIKALARFFWFTVEFGLMRKNTNDICAYGSGLLSSYAELAFSINDKKAQRYPLSLEWVINQYFEIDHYQPLYFIVDSFQHLYDQVDLIEAWLLDGKLDNVSLGEPFVSDSDVESFTHAAID